MERIIMAEQELFNRLLSSMLFKNESEFNAAVDSATQMNITPLQFQNIMEKIELWCRMKGLLPLKLHEKHALIKLQSFFRLQYVRKKIREKYLFYRRLSMTDSEEYALLAHKYHRLLKL